MVYSICMNILTFSLLSAIVASMAISEESLATGAKSAANKQNTEPKVKTKGLLIPISSAQSAAPIIISPPSIAAVSTSLPATTTTSLNDLITTGYDFKIGSQLSSSALPIISFLPSFSSNFKPSVESIAFDPLLTSILLQRSSRYPLAPMIYTLPRFPLII